MQWTPPSFLLPIEGKGNAGGGAERGVEGERTLNPVDARVVTHQPGEAQNEFEMTQPHHVSGKDLSMVAMDAETRCVAVGDGTSGELPSMSSRGMGWVWRSGWS